MGTEGIVGADRWATMTPDHNTTMIQTLLRNSEIRGHWWNKYCATMTSYRIGATMT
jgi:hypothetical protein